MSAESNDDISEVIMADVDVEEEDDTYHDSKSISAIAMIANVMAWVLLVLSVAGLIVLGVVIYDARASIGGTANGVFSIVSAIVPFFPGFFFFVVLKAVAEGLYVLIDIEANTRRAHPGKIS
jgi:hypothetical protein